MGKPKLLVHVCCAPDALYVLGFLRADYEVIGYFYNPNIHPREEYDLRLEETRKVARILNVNLIEGEYNDQWWFEITQKFKEEPERGRRCDVCYALRLEKTAREASELGFEIFTTVMSLSPLKKADVLNRMGKMFARKHRVDFLAADFKKKDGFKKSVEMSRKHELYRQDYCGCLYSKRQTKRKSIR
ncbi:MAG: epoxyqueuosine reductase QueH [Candidatus Aminicenantes bacterium]|nr:epoxyqueuosine reductase QueH [Candidatus Aminicenantes bacterium]MDH5705232.1 epoxyqueuosine reductase QueH [Candidatus Aminicenantes bacterium]